MATASSGEEMCSLHGMVTEFICQSHEQFGCKKCMETDHSGCKNTKTIGELANDIENNSEYTQFQEDINEMRFISEEITEHINERQDYVNEGLTEEKETLACLRADINNIFDTIHANIEEREIIAKAKDTEAVEKFTREADNAITDLETIENKLENLKRMKKFQQFFITLKKAKPEIRTIENQLENVVTNLKPQSRAEHPVLPEVKGETEVELIKMEEAVIQFKMLMSRSNLTQQQ